MRCICLGLWLLKEWHQQGGIGQKLFCNDTRIPKGTAVASKSHVRVSPVPIFCISSTWECGCSVLSCIAQLLDILPKCWFFLLHLAQMSFYCSQWRTFTEKKKLYYKPNSNRILSGKGRNLRLNIWINKCFTYSLNKIYSQYSTIILLKPGTVCSKTCAECEKKKNEAIWFLKTTWDPRAADTVTLSMAKYGF